MRSVNARLMVIVAGLALFFFGGVYVWSEQQQRAAKLLKDDLVAERASAIQQFLAIERSQYGNLLKDIAAMPGTKKALADPESANAEIQLLLPATNAGFEMVWLLDSKGRVLYRGAPDRDARILASTLQPDPQHKSADGYKWSEYFTSKEGQIVQFFQTKVSASGATAGGTLVAARIWDDSMKERLLEVTKSSVDYMEKGGALFLASEQPNALAKDSRITNFVQLKDSKGKEAATIRFLTRSPAIERIDEQSRRAIWLAAVFSIFMVVVMAGTLHRWVGRPMARARMSLESRDPEALSSLRDDPTEFGQFARLIEQFFQQSLQLRDANKELEAAVKELGVMNDQLDSRVQERTTELAEAYEATIAGWSRAMEVRDHETQGHCQRVTEMAMLLGRSMGLARQDMIRLKRGALLHDIGKMGIPDSILLKPGRLTDEERAIMERHPVIAYDMLKPIRFLGNCLDVPLYHHEKWDGTGYPYGLVAEKIPMNARIFAVADVWDALRSDRPYRQAWDEQKTRDYIIEQSGTHFDPQVVQAYLSLTEGELDQLRQSAMNAELPTSYVNRAA